MNEHLSSEQFARCFVGGATDDERNHVRECSKCQTELEQLDGVIGSFRRAVRGRIEQQTTLRPAPPMPGSLRLAEARNPRWRPAMATAAAVLLGVLPLLMTEGKLPGVATKPSSQQTDPNALMESVNIHLLRTIPAPMERVMVLLPQQESTESGGIQ
jgi:hypothetical protein